MSLALGQQVELVGKDVTGVIAYIGTTHFAQGKWFGVILDEPKGKNNGTVGDKSYFQCEMNHGIFVKQMQLKPLGSGKSTPVVTPAGKSMQSKLPQASKGKTPASGPPTSRGKSDLGRSKDEALSSSSSLESLTRAAGVATPITTVPVPPAAGPPPTSKQEPNTPRSTPETIEELEKLRLQKKDLEEKLETLHARRENDKEKLREMDKLKLQLEQLLEFKAQILETQAQLQKELSEARREAKEAIDAKKEFEEEMSDYTDRLEMVTLDKEMAEERAEGLKEELEEANNKIESLTLDTKILKAEMEGKEGGDGSKSYQVKQLEEQNLQLRDVIMKLRDHIASEKQESVKLQKTIEEQKQQLKDVASQKGKQEENVMKLETSIAELQEQVDAALGAERMVEQLTERNLNLEAKVEEMQETIRELEKLNDMNEQLQEGARDVELELREEVDMMQAAVREAKRAKEAAEEILTDREETIKKFRELVSQLQTQNGELREQLQRETSKPLPVAVDKPDFTKEFEKSKAQARAIEMVLRDLELEQASLHLKWLLSFMPEKFLQAGGDHEGMLNALLIRRMIYKCEEVLTSQVQKGFPPPENIDKNSVFESHSVDAYSFASQFLQLLHALQMILHEYDSSLQTCTPEAFLKLGSVHLELSAQEKLLDFYIDLLKRDQLDENVPLDNLEKIVMAMSNIFETYLRDSPGQNIAKFLSFFARSLQSASECILIEVSRISVLLQDTFMADEIGKLLADLKIGCETIRSNAKKVKHGLPMSSSLSLDDTSVKILRHSSMEAIKLSKVLREIGRLSLQYLLSSGDRDQKIAPGKLKEFALLVCDDIYGLEEGGSGPVACLTNSLNQIAKSIADIEDNVSSGKYETLDRPAELEKLDPPVPLKVRAETIKDEAKDVDKLRNKLKIREEDLTELKRLLKSKQDEVSELNIRREMAEKKLSTLLEEKGLVEEKLQRKLEDHQTLLRRKDKEYLDSMTQLQSDIDQLVAEKAILRKQLLESSRKPVLPGTPAIHDIPPMTSISPDSIPSTPTHTVPSAKSGKDAIKQVEVLREALQFSRLEVQAARVSQLKEKLAQLKPLDLPKKSFKCQSWAKLPSDADTLDTADLSPKEREIMQIARELRVLQTESLKVMLPSLVDVSHRKPGTEPPIERLNPSFQLLSQTMQQKKLQEHIFALKEQMNRLLVQELTPHVEHLKAMRKKPQNVGHVILPVIPGVQPGHVEVSLDQFSMRRIHDLLCIA